VADGSVYSKVEGGPVSLVTISALTKEYVRAQVYAKEAGVEVNPTTYVVEMACPINGVVPVSGDWKTASWEVDNGTYWARVLVGTGSTLVLAAGYYDVWVRITAPSETPVKKVGQLQVI
jgi:hypothetical protein